MLLVRATAGDSPGGACPAQRAPAHWRCRRWNSPHRIGERSALSSIADQDTRRRVHRSPKPERGQVAPTVVKAPRPTFACRLTVTPVRSPQAVDTTRTSMGTGPTSAAFSDQVSLKRCETLARHLPRPNTVGLNGPSRPAWERDGRRRARKHVTTTARCRNSARSGRPVRSAYLSQEQTVDSGLESRGRHRRPVGLGAGVPGWPAC